MRSAVRRKLREACDRSVRKNRRLRRQNAAISSRCSVRARSATSWCRARFARREPACRQENLAGHGHGTARSTPAPSLSLRRHRSGRAGIRARSVQRAQTRLRRAGALVCCTLHACPRSDSRRSAPLSAPRGHHRPPFAAGASPSSAWFALGSSIAHGPHRRGMRTAARGPASSQSQRVPPVCAARPDRDRLRCVMTDVVPS